jgi:hypothetical protein
MDPAAEAATRGDAPSTEHGTLARLEALLTKHPDAISARPNKLLGALDAFVSANERPSTSPNFRARDADRVGAVGELLRDCLAHPLAHASDEAVERLLELTLKLYKILSRKAPNRLELGRLTIGALCACLVAPLPAALLAECCNVLLNVCYEQQVVALALGHDALASLVRLVERGPAELQAAAAGAIQSIAFQKAGREAAHACGAARALVPLLDAAVPKLAYRAVGAIHNLTSDARAIEPLREAGAIAPLVKLLRANAAAPCANAAGALQNCARDSLARLELQRLGALVPLTDLLYANDEACRTCAVGALLNLIGPDLGEETDRNAKRVVLKRTLGLACALGELHARTAPDAPSDISWVAPGSCRRADVVRPSGGGASEGSKPEVR